MNKSRFASMVSGVVAAGVLASAAAPANAAIVPGKTNFAFQNVSFPGDPRFTQLLGINEHNVIAGYHGDENTEMTPNKGFTLTLPSNFTDENFPNSAQTQVIGINNDGDTVGFYVDAGGQTHGFMKSRDFETVDLPGTTFNQLLGINNKDQAAGYFQDAAGLQHAYIHEKNGNFLVLNIPMPSSQATSINDDGDIVGFEQSSPQATTSSGYLIKDGKLIRLDFPGSTFTQALGINDRDEIVGSYNDAAGTTHGFMYRNGEWESVDVPGTQSTVVNGLNKEGRIVGFSMDAAGNTIGFVGDRAAAKQTVLKFDDLSNIGQPLNGQYPQGVADWGNNAWYLSGPYGKDGTNSVSFNGAGPTSAELKLLSPRVLMQLDANNGGGTTSSNVTLACSGQPSVSVHLEAGEAKTVVTQWSAPCSTVTISSSNGWFTNFDNIVLE